MPKAKSQENKENATVVAETKKEDFKLEAGKEDDDSGEDSDESEEGEEETAVASTEQPVCIHLLSFFIVFAD